MNQKLDKSGDRQDFGQEECMKLEQDAMLADADQEEEFIKCFDDITGRDRPWKAVKEARAHELWQRTTQ